MVLTHEYHHPVVERTVAWMICFDYTSLLLITEKLYPRPKNAVQQDPSFRAIGATDGAGCITLVSIGQPFSLPFDKSAYNVHQEKDEQESVVHCNSHADETVSRATELICLVGEEHIEHSKGQHHHRVAQGCDMNNAEAERASPFSLGCVMQFKMEFSRQAAALQQEDRLSGMLAPSHYLSRQVCASA